MCLQIVGTVQCTDEFEQIVGTAPCRGEFEQIVETAPCRGELEKTALVAIHVQVVLVNSAACSAVYFDATPCCTELTVWNCCVL